MPYDFKFFVGQNFDCSRHEYDSLNIVIEAAYDNWKRIIVLLT